MSIKNVTGLDLPIRGGGRGGQAGPGLRPRPKTGVRNFGRRAKRGDHCPVATKTTAAGQRRSHTPPSPGAAERSYLPGTRERPGPPCRRIALSKGARPLKDRQTQPSVRLYNLPAPTALPPPDDVNPRERKSRLPPGPRGCCPRLFVL